ncbi:UNVERIFIED_CONTAM: Pentatricopeptide repeat-containing protein [Sesamum latifolium]|uniref:Pentatricopeptide repeat-containing protein n=1 Tax=Sesamum latifolium TaxID=2727402 RepID=A0AAW2WKF6_9LAMI
MPTIDHTPTDLSSTVIRRVCFWVCESYYDQQRGPSHFKSRLPVLSLPIGYDFLTPDQAITVVAALADEAGSMVALSFFYWAIGFPKFRHFMRLYIVSATCFIKNGNFERTHEVLSCMLRNFAEVGMLKEAVDMVLEMQSQGLVLSAHTLNCVLSVVNEMGCVEMAESVFDEMCERGVVPDPYSSSRWLYCIVDLGEFQMLIDG